MSKPKYRWVAMFYDGDETTIAYRTKLDAEYHAAERARLYECKYFIAKVGSWTYYAPKEGGPEQAPRKRPAFKPFKGPI